MKDATGRERLRLTKPTGETTIRAVSELTPDESADAVDANASAPTDPPTSAQPTTPQPTASPAVRAFIVVAVLLQLVVPLTYYLRDDPYDERFAWRMFSGIRLLSCTTTARETYAGRERTVSLYRVVSPGWVANIERNRRAVIDRYLEHRCALEQVRDVRLTNRCRDVDGEDLPPIEYARDCTTGDTP